MSGGGRLLPPDFLLYLKLRIDMASFSIEIPDDQVDRVITAMCANYHYPAQISNPDYDPTLEMEEDYDPATNPEAIDNPETQDAFANRMVREYLQNNTAAYEIQLAKQQARQNLAAVPAITNPAL